MILAFNKHFKSILMRQLNFGDLFEELKGLIT